MDINAKELDKRIVEFKASKEPKNLLLGYKTFSKLVKENKFSENLIQDSNNQLIKHYRGIEITIVTEKHYFEVV